VILASTLGITSSTLISKYLQKQSMEKAKQEADFNLRLLVSQLHNIEVRTSLELLKDSKLNQAQPKYKIIFNDEDKIPKLKQYKYIDVPLSNGREETILQEHVFGDEDYEISVQSPEKEYEFKLTKASMGV